MTQPPQPARDLDDAIGCALLIVAAGFSAALVIAALGFAVSQ